MDIILAANIAKFAYTTPTVAVGSAIISSKGTSFFYNYKFIDIGGTQCFIMEDKTSLIIAIRGSDQIEDYCLSLNTSPSDGEIIGNSDIGENIGEGIGKVHEGFHSAFLNVIVDVFRSVDATEKDIYFIGHSYGGAVAKLMGLFWNNKGVNVITFGEPKSCVDEHPSDTSSYIRIVNDLDIIPHLPARFTHGIEDDTVVFLDSKGRVRHNPSSLYVAYRRIFIWVVRLLLVIKPFKAIADHSMDSYIKNLSKNLYKH